MKNNKGVVERMMRAGAKVLDFGKRTAKGEVPTVTLGVLLPEVAPNDFVISAFAMGAVPDVHMALAARTTDPNFPLSVLRNDICVEALANGTDYVLLMNHDLAVPQTALVQLLQWGERDVVGAIYRNKYPPYNLIVESESRREVAEGITEVNSIPMGFALIRAETLRKMKRPWFKEEFKEGTEDAPMGTMLTDFQVFCRDVRAASMKVWADISLSKQCGRIGKNVFMADTDYGSARAISPVSA